MTWRGGVSHQSSPGKIHGWGRHMEQIMPRGLTLDSGSNSVRCICSGIQSGKARAPWSNERWASTGAGRLQDSNTARRKEIWCARAWERKVKNAPRHSPRLHKGPGPVPKAKDKEEWRLCPTAQKLAAGLKQNGISGKGNSKDRSPEFRQLQVQWEWRARGLGRG